jgi:hypothetical protein
MPVFERGLATNLRSGRHAYLNVSPAGYLLKRAKGEAQEWLGFVRDLFKERGVEPRLALSAPRVESLFWKNGDRITLCVVHNIDRRAAIDGFGDLSGELGQGSVKLKLSFAQAVKGLKNERNGKELGDGRDFEDAFVPWEANVYTYTR